MLGPILQTPPKPERTGFGLKSGPVLQSLEYLGESSHESSYAYRLRLNLDDAMLELNTAAENMQTNTPLSFRHDLVRTLAKPIQHARAHKIVKHLSRQRLSHRTFPNLVASKQVESDGLPRLCELCIYCGTLIFPRANNQNITRFVKCSG